MELSKLHLRSLIEDALAYLDPVVPYSDEAVELLMLTAAAETHGGNYIGYLNDENNGNGIFQMKQSTMRYVIQRADGNSIPKIKWKIIGVMAAGLTCKQNLRSNLMFQIVTARLYYWSHAEAIPKNTDGLEMWGVNLAKYWKKYWNTILGAGSWPRAYEDWLRYTND